MKACNCTLNLINPEACKNCSIYYNENDLEWTGTPYIPYGPDSIPYIPYEPSPTTPQLEIRKVKRITRTIEKYDKHGNYKGKEIVTEEEEIYDKEVWKYGITYCDSDSTGEIVDGDQLFFTSCIN